METGNDGVLPLVRVRGYNTPYQNGQGQTGRTDWRDGNLPVWLMASARKKGRGCS